MEKDGILQKLKSLNVTNVVVATREMEKAFKRAKYKRFKPMEFKYWTKLPKRLTVYPIENQAMKVGRNKLCPCGSGKKFKKCHGKNFK